MFKKFSLLFIFIMISAVFVNGMAYQAGIMGSAETINPGNFKLAIYPALVFGKNGGDSIWGVGGKAGYGLSRNLDVEASAASFKNFSYFGADLEYWFYRGNNLNAAISGGFHITDYELGGNSSGFDISLLGSTKPTRRMEVYTGVKISFDSFKNGGDTKVIHLIPGIEYKLRKEVDFLAEFGIALNDVSRNYLSFGLAYYFN